MLYWPVILLHCVETVRGPNYAARVEMRCRVLLVEEGDKNFWVYGVQPGGVAGTGRDTQSAIENFQSGVKSVLLDLLPECNNFEKFKAGVEELHTCINLLNLEQWEGLIEEFGKTMGADLEAKLEITRVDL